MKGLNIKMEYYKWISISELNGTKVKIIITFQPIRAHFLIKLRNAEKMSFMNKACLNNFINSYLYDLF